MLEHHHPRLALACSFQKEEAVLIDMLLALEPAARVFTIDTGALFPETYEAWRALERHYGVRVEVFDALRDGQPAVERAQLLLGAEGRRARPRARRASTAGSPACAASRRRRARPRRSSPSTSAAGSGRPTRWPTGTSAACGTTSRARRALQPAARPRLRVDRLRALHASRGRTRRALGGQRQDRVRHPRLSRRRSRRHGVRSAGLTHLRALESEAMHVMREVAAGFERPVLLFSGGKDSIVLLRLAEKAFRPARFPFPLMHVDTGENFPEAIEFRDRRVAELGERLIVASVQDSIDKGRVSRRPARARRATACRPRPCSTRSPSTASTPRSAAPAATRSAPAPRSASSASATTSASGTPKPSAPNSGTSTTPTSTPANTSASSRSRTGPSSTSGSTSTAKRSRCPPSTSPTPARPSSATACSTPTARARAPPRRNPRPQTVRYRTVGDMTCTGAIAHTATTIPQIVNEITATRITERGQTRADDQTAKPPWKTAKKPDTSSAGAATLQAPMTLDLLRFTTAGSVDDGKSTLIGRLLYDSKQVFEDQLEHVTEVSGGAGARDRPRAAHRRPARRARAGDHDRRRLSLFRDRRGGASSSPTAPATSSTPATW